MNSPPVPDVKISDSIAIICPGPEYSNFYENLLPQLDSALKAAEEGGADGVVLDMQHIRFVGSAFLGRLVAAHKHAAARGARFSLRSVSSFCRAAMSVAKLDTLLEIESA